MSSRRSAVTILASRDDVQAQLERHRDALPDLGDDVTFADAPGDRGTEVYAAPKAKGDLRTLKALVETGEVPRSEGQVRPAQPAEQEVTA